MMNYPYYEFHEKYVNFEMKNQLVPSHFFLSGRWPCFCSSQHFRRTDVIVAYVQNVGILVINLYQKSECSQKGDSILQYFTGGQTKTPSILDA